MKVQKTASGSASLLKKIVPYTSTRVLAAHLHVVTRDALLEPGYANLLQVEAEKLFDASLSVWKEYFAKSIAACEREAKLYNSTVDQKRTKFDALRHSPATRLFEDAIGELKLKADEIDFTRPVDFMTSWESSFSAARALAADLSKARDEMAKWIQIGKKAADKTHPRCWQCN